MGIFEPFRAIGYITSSVPFSVQRLGTETFVTVSVGKSWQIYNCAKLSLVLVGPQLAKKIRALASYRDYTFAAYGNDIGVFKRAHQVATWSRHNAKVNLLLLFGEHVLSVDVEGNVFIWAFKGTDENPSPVGHILLDNEFTPSCIMHPDTYLNKVIFGSQDGSLQLWNISTKKKLYEFKGWNSSISCCVSSPALDVIAVGCADGKIHVHNIHYDEEVVAFSQTTRGAVTALSFRTDGQPLLASGGSSGVISIWNLEKRRLQSVIRDAHDSSVISLHFFANEPVLMSTSADNSIKMWIFDTSDGDPRLLKFRSGHSAPPLCIRFYANGRHILSAGQDRAFRLFSVIQDQQSRELSQRHVTKRAKKLKVKQEEIKLKPVIAFDVAEIRERDWSNVVTCHMDTPHAYVWRLQNFVLGEHILTPTTDIQAPVKACTISSCGNFAILGTAGGWIEKFNLQSGMSRGCYVDMSEKGSCAHDGEVVGVACDSTNSLMISAGYNGDVKVWSFKGRELKSRWEIGCKVVKIIYHRSNGLLASVTDDLVIRMFDVVALKMVRKFEGHTDRITDICFSEDGKWLLSSSMDGTLRIWDVIFARQIDAIHVDVSITALSLSPNMDVLATTHVDQNGVYLWVNQAMFSGAPHIDSYGSGKEVVKVKLPSISSGVGGEEGSKDDGDSDNKPPTFTNSQPPQLLDKQIPDLVTLSMLPKSQWQSLINLDIIKERNKPIEPPKKPEKAPFFLPSILEKTCIWAEKPVNNEWNTELASNVSYSTKYSTLGGRRHRRTLTEAEKEARKIRRVLANRESARQTIRRRQAIYEELARKAGDLAWENKNLKRKKEMASKELDILKVTNECLKAKMIKITKMYGHTYCSSSTNSPIMMCNQSSFPPFTWPPMIVLPYPWLFPFLQNNNQNHPHFNLNEKPVESSSSPGNLLSDSKQIVHKNHQVPGVCSVKTVCDMAAAAEARKRRKNLKMEKSLFCRQRRMR